MNNQLNWKLLGLAGMMMLWPLFGAAQVNLDSGLVAYWPFNGNADDESGNGLNGFVSGATLVADRFGQEGRAYEFDNVDDFIEVANENGQLDLMGEWSISCWIKPYSADTADIPSDDPIIMKIANAGTNEDNYYIAWSVPNDGLNYSVWANSERNDGTDFVVTSDSLPINNYYHIVLRLKVDVSELFINGQKVDSIAVVPNFVPYQGPEALRIGNARNRVLQGQVFDGIIDDIRIYDRAVNLAEIDSLNNEESVSTNISPVEKLVISLSPNPALGAFTLHSPQATIQSLALYDLTGRRLPAEINHDRHEAQVHSSYRGLALVKVQTDQGLWVEKVRME